MQPRHAADEAFQKQRCRNGAAVAALGGAGHVAEISDFALQPAAIGGEQRQPPHGILGSRRGVGHALRHLVVVGEESRQIRAQGDTRGAGERGEVHHQRRFFRRRKRQRVGQHQAALGIGVAHFDGEAGVGADDVARPKRRAGDGVLHRRHQHPQIDGQRLRHHQLRQRQHVRRAAHVLLHQAHGVAGLEIEAAAVEAHALAHQHHQRVIGVAPAQVDQARRGGAGAAHGVDGVEAVTQQRIARGYRAAGAVAERHRPRRGFKVVRQHVRRRGVDPVSALADRLPLVQHRLVGDQQLWHGPGRGLVGVEAISAEAPAEGQLVLLALLFGPSRRQSVLVRRQFGGEAA